MSEPNIIKGVQSNSPIDGIGNQSLKKIVGNTKFEEFLSSKKGTPSFLVRMSIANRLSNIAMTQRSIEDNKNIEGRLFGAKLNNMI